MDGDINLNATPLSSISKESRNLLFLLNTKKVLLSDGPEKLPRDWRGLASLVNISSEVAGTLNECSDKTVKVLEIWIQRDSSVTVGKLLEYLQRLDRHDIYDDLLELARLGKLVDRQNQVQAFKQISALDDTRDDMITFDDVKYRHPQLYHAYVLFANEDKDFVDELLRRMRAGGFKICTEDDLLPVHSTQYAAVSKLISERCHRIILVYSPEFLRSPANTFYMNYAQAVGIEMNKPKIIPCMYRECQLPPHLTFYHKLYYSPPGQKAAYNFWERLSQALEVVNLPRLNSSPTTSSQIHITEITHTSVSNGYSADGDKVQVSLALPTPPAKSASMNGLNTLQVQRIPPEDSKSLSNVSQISDGKQKKPNLIRKMINSVTRKKHRKPIMLEN